MEILANILISAIMLLSIFLVMGYTILLLFLWYSEYTSLKRMKIKDKIKDKAKTR